MVDKTILFQRNPCERCGGPIRKPKNGVPRRFCGNRCRLAAQKGENNTIIQTSVLRREYYLSGKGGRGSRELE